MHGCGRVFHSLLTFPVFFFFSKLKRRHLSLKCYLFVFQDSVFSTYRRQCLLFDWFQCQKCVVSILSLPTCDEEKSQPDLKIISDLQNFFFLSLQLALLNDVLHNFGEGISLFWRTRLSLFWLEAKPKSTHHFLFVLVPPTTKKKERNEDFRAQKFINLWSWPFLPDVRIGSLHLWKLFIFSSKQKKFCCCSNSLPPLRKAQNKNLCIEIFQSVFLSKEIHQKCVSCPKLPSPPPPVVSSAKFKMVRHHRLAASKRIADDSSSSSITNATSTSSLMWRRRCGCYCGSVRWPTWPPMLLLLLLVSVETLSLATVTTATRMHYIHWNTTNPM